MLGKLGYTSVVDHDQLGRYLKHDRLKFVQGGGLDMQPFNIAFGVEDTRLGVPHGLHSKGMLHYRVLLCCHDLPIGFADLD